MATCITHEPNHEINGYQTPITGNFVCSVCGPYCSCNEDLAACVVCERLEHYLEMFSGERILLDAPECVDILGIDKYGYACENCYQDAWEHDYTGHTISLNEREN